MKKTAIFLACIAMFTTSTMQAQTYSSKPPAPKGASKDEFNWGIALVSVAVLGTVVGLTAASAASSPNTYSVHH
jgi:hypothetical protein